jgi:hypothetical protein
MICGLEHVVVIWWPIRSVEKEKCVFPIEMQVWFDVLAEDGLGEELMSCVNESNCDQEDQSEESGFGSNDTKT